jgi:hypothetical protein
VLFNQGGAGLASEQFLAWFMGCDNNCTVASNWAGRSVGEEWDGHRGVDLQLVAGTPVVALSTHTGASVFRCTANCSSRQPSFAATPIESDAQLTTLLPPPNLQGCTNPVWDSGNHPSLAVDPTGKHLTVLFEAVSITHCPSYELAADVMRVYDLVVP